MDFHAYTTASQLMKSVCPTTRRKTWSDALFYWSKTDQWVKIRRGYDRWLHAGGSDHKHSNIRMGMESDWMADERPYYNVYPAIIPMLLKLKLEIPISAIVPAFKTMLVRFPKETKKDTWASKNDVRCLLLQHYPRHEILTVAVNSNEKDTNFLGCLSIPVGATDVYVAHDKHAKFTPDTTYTQFLDYVYTTSLAGCDISRCPPGELMQLVLTLCMLGNDPQIMQPDVLAQDRRAWEETKDDKYVQRARRRGKNGWCIGAGLEVIPHARAPGPAIYWTGPGGKVPQLLWRKGTFVHRKKITSIPSGYLDTEVA